MTIDPQVLMALLAKSGMGGQPQGAPGGMPAGPQPPGAMPSPALQPPPLGMAPQASPAPMPSPQPLMNPSLMGSEPTGQPTMPSPADGDIQRSPLGALLLPQGQPLMSMMQRLKSG